MTSPFSNWVLPDSDSQNKKKNWKSLIWMNQKQFKLAETGKKEKSLKGMQGEKS